MSHRLSIEKSQSSGSLLSKRMPIVGGVGSLLWLLGPLIVLGLSFLLTTGEGRQVFIPWWNVSLPETCYFHRLFGIDCPGCGLTRSFLLISSGDLQGAFLLNPIGILLYTYLIFQVPQALLRWVSDETRRSWLSDATLNRWTRINEWALIGIMVGLVVRWCVRLAIGDFF